MLYYITYWFIHIYTMVMYNRYYIVLKLGWAIRFFEILGWAESWGGQIWGEGGQGGVGRYVHLCDVDGSAELDIKLLLI